ncbi:hypothetical protein SAMN04488581_2556 [Mycolicibacterium neoaurum]|uniref:hypothetical protein n=1 Tax=Mycolicibacterium neoaurum TaxID=1795 RepID=UPI000889A2BB|nr:hypothetical protein [Mycolicibacterium neoaurum]SDD56718.1 hypothetical protein SAMN04488581_2556 [Mycolicibacterium neoaurum]
MELVLPAAARVVPVVPAVLVLPAAARVVPVELAALVLPVAELVVVPVRPEAVRVVLALVVPAAQVPEPVEQVEQVPEPVERAPVLPSRQALRWSMPREQVLRWQAVFRGPAVRRAQRSSMPLVRRPVAALSPVELRLLTPRPLLVAVELPVQAAEPPVLPVVLPAVPHFIRLPVWRLRQAPPRASWSTRPRWHRRQRSRCRSLLRQWSTVGRLPLPPPHRWSAAAKVRPPRQRLVVLTPALVVERLVVVPVVAVPVVVRLVAAALPAVAPVVVQLVAERPVVVLVERALVVERPAEEPVVPVVVRPAVVLVVAVQLVAPPPVAVVWAAQVPSLLAELSRAAGWPVRRLN